jgi:peptidoglycan hydrolase-like protein with peptidoglycan-binding domain
MFTFALSASRVPNSTVTATITQSQPYQTANLVRPDDPKPQTSSPSLKDVTIVQNRLIELGYLVGPADGVWGPRSRNALLAFKISNGLPADDKWDPAVNNRLLSANVVRGPLTAASNQSTPAQPNRFRPVP